VTPSEAAKPELYKGIVVFESAAPQHKRLQCYDACVGVVVENAVNFFFALVHHLVVDPVQREQCGVQQGTFIFWVLEHFKVELAVTFSAS
jgi:hypothetical protein